MVGWVGLEPTANGLKGRCSTTELPTQQTNNKALTQVVLTCFGVAEPVFYNPKWGYDNSHTKNTDAPTRQTSNTRVGESLWRNNATGIYYAFIKRRGKQFHLSLSRSALWHWVIAWRKINLEAGHFEISIALSLTDPTTTATPR
jgi:hypothetical protein